MNRATTENELSESVDARVVALTHYLPPYMKAVLAEVAEKTRDFSVLLSTKLEPNRQFDTDWSGLKVTVQKSLMLRRPWKHGAGFKDELYVHLPYDTFSQLRRAKPDIIFSYELGMRSMISAIYRRLHRRSRLAICVCVSEHTEQNRGAARGLLRRWLVRQADAITYNGPSCRRYLERFPIPADRLFHFPYAQVSANQFTGPLERNAASSHRLVCIGQLIERKGVIPMLDSLKKYCETRGGQQVDLTFIGTGPLDEVLKNSITPDNLKVQFIGHIPAQNVASELAKYGVMIFPTLADEWGLVVNEAMQAGLPVLGSQFAQASITLIRDGENGWLYNPHEPESLYRQLDAMYATSVDQLNRMRYAAQASVADITTSSFSRQSTKGLSLSDVRFAVATLANAPTCNRSHLVLGQVLASCWIPFQLLSMLLNPAIEFGIGFSISRLVAINQLFDPYPS